MIHPGRQPLPIGIDKLQVEKSEVKAGKEKRHGHNGHTRCEQGQAVILGANVARSNGRCSRCGMLDPSIDQPGRVRW
jgi:hypothetical protein